MTALLTGSEYRQSSRERVRRYKEAMLEKGYTQFLCFISAEMKAEIERIKSENQWSNIEALEHIYSVYISVNTNIKDQVEPEQASTDLIKSKNRKSKNAPITPPDLYPNKQGELLFDQTDKQTMNQEPDAVESIFINAMESIPLIGDKTYTAWVKNLIKALVQLGTMTNREIKAVLEQHKIQTSRGLDAWAVGTVGSYVAEIKKAATD